MRDGPRRGDEADHRPPPATASVHGWWRRSVTVLTGCGLVCAAVEWGWTGPAGVLVSAAFVATMVRGCFLVAPSRSSIRPLVSFGLAVGATVVAAAGLLAAFALPGVLLVLAAVATSPPARRLLGASASPAASRVTVVPPPDVTRLRLDAAPLPTVTPEGLDDVALCQAWRRSFLLLQTAEVERRLRVVELRQRYLDELDRRHPLGLSRWLASGARAAGNPLPFLVDHDSAT